MKKIEILSFMDAQSILMLTTMNGNQPETRALVNIRNKNIAPHLTKYFQNSDKIFLMTNTHTDKILQIKKNSVANLYAYDDKFNGLLLMGDIKENIDKNIHKDLWDDSWKVYYPAGMDGGDFSLLEFYPKQFKYYKYDGHVKTCGAI